jgi:hypothetical protein
MAYNFIPTTLKEILQKSEYKNAKQSQAEIVVLFNYLKNKYPDIESPLALDPGKPNAVKITRRITSGESVPSIKRATKVKTINMTPGEGSRGGRGAGNRGNAFEQQLEKDIMAWVRGDAIQNSAHATFIEEFVNHYKLTRIDKIVVINEAALNKRRPLQFNGDAVTIGKSSTFNIGDVVTDITVESTNTKQVSRTIYLSLKYGPTVSFFNVGIGTIFSGDDFKNKKSTDGRGRALLKLFGLEEESFFRSFESSAKNRPKLHTVDVTQKINKGRLIAFLKSGIGFGYHLVHFLNNRIEHQEMTNRFLESAALPQSVVVKYGGASGDALRVDIFLETPMYSFKINLRNKQGGVKPTHIMSDYKAKHH